MKTEISLATGSPTCAWRRRFGHGPDAPWEGCWVYLSHVGTTFAASLRKDVREFAAVLDCA